MSKVVYFHDFVALKEVLEIINEHEQLKPLRIIQNNKYVIHPDYEKWLKELTIVCLAIIPALNDIKYQEMAKDSSDLLDALKMAQRMQLTSQLHGFLEQISQLRKGEIELTNDDFRFLNRLKK